MLGITSTLKELRGGFRGYIAKIQAATDESPPEAAEFMADQWRRGVRKDTHSYELGIYVQTHDASGYQAAVARAQEVNPGVGIHPELAKPARKGAAAVGSVVTHDYYNEYGSHTIAAKPAFEPALAATRKQYPEITRRKLQP